MILHPREGVSHARPAVAALLGALALALAPGDGEAASRTLGARIQAELRAYASARADLPPEAVEVPDLSGFEVEAVDPDRAEIRLSTAPRNRCLLWMPA